MHKLHRRNKFKVAGSELIETAKSGYNTVERFLNSSEFILGHDFLGAMLEHRIGWSLKCWSLEYTVQ